MKITFSFGRNWRSFLATLDEERIVNAKSSLLEFMELEDLHGKTFLDIGCGSGLFSYAAHLAGAKKVVSFDLDPVSVECARKMRERVEVGEVVACKTDAGKSVLWEISEGSVLDFAFISKLDRFDIVFSWGVLHHTGNMWQAIKNAARLVSKDGLFYIAIYNKVEEPFGSKFWLAVKKRYNASGFFVKKAFELSYALLYFGYNLARLRNPLKRIAAYKSHRGMSWWHDIVDWFGGYPYEFATVEEIFLFMKKEFPRFKLVNVKSTNGPANNWFLFKNESA
jgi:SAM-dependent methyltransferase